MRKKNHHVCISNITKNILFYYGYLQGDRGLNREQRRRQCTRTHRSAGTTTLQRRMGKRRRRGSNSSLDGGGRSRVFEFHQRTFTNVTSARMRKDVGQGTHTFHYPTLPLCHTNENPPLHKPPHSSFGGVNVFTWSIAPTLCVSVLYTIHL